MPRRAAEFFDNEEPINSLYQLIRCGAVGIKKTLQTRYKDTNQPLAITETYYGFILLPTIFCDNTADTLHSKKDFNGLNLKECSSSFTITLNSNAASGNINRSLYTLTKNNKEVLTNHCTALLELLRENEFVYKKEYARNINHVFSAMMKDDDTCIYDLQTFWVEFINVMCDEIRRNPYFPVSTKEILQRLIDYFVESHPIEFKNNTILDSEDFCKKAADIYLTLFLVAAANIDSDLITFILDRLSQKELPADIKDRRAILEKVSGLIVREDIHTMTKIRFLSQTYFELINDPVMQSSLFSDNNFNAKEAAVVYAKFSDICRDRREMVFNEYDFRNRYVIRDFLRYENNITRFSGTSHGKTIEFSLRHADSYADDALKKWYESFPENDYSKNKSYFIWLTPDEIGQGIRRGELYLIKNGEDIAGVALLCTEVDTERSRTKYNGGRMKTSLEQLGFYERSYSVLNTVIIKPEYRGFGLQKLFTQLLVELAIKAHKSAVIATVSPTNVFSYRNFLEIGFTDLDQDKKPEECAVNYGDKEHSYPRHIVILDLYRKLIDAPDPVAIPQLSKRQTLHYLNSYWDSSKDHNPRYVYYKGKNCQNFVSQALVAGGFPLSRSFLPAIRARQGIAAIFDEECGEYVERKATVPFVNVEAFINYMKSLKVEYISDVKNAISEAKPFDILITNNTGHAMFVTKVEKKSQSIFASGNTNDREPNKFAVPLDIISGLLRTSIYFK